MITYVAGDLFNSPAQVLTNTVNTAGVMGKGIAKRFKEIYPEMFAEYRDICERGKLKVGSLWLYKTVNKWILNFPTKQHWRHPSKEDYIEAGLKKFIAIYSKAGIHSIAFPALGCGNGELDFKTQVKPLMEKYLKRLPINVFIYAGRRDPYVPEHKTPKEIKEWLRSEPEMLSFSEVWDDLCNLLGKRQSFKTLKQQSPFIVSLEEDAKRIVVSTNTNKHYFAYDQLLDFWQQLRRYGFSASRIVPNGLEKYMSYLLPVFSELEYVKPVLLTDDYDKWNANPSIGLQYMPPANGQTKQLELF